MHKKLEIEFGIRKIQEILCYINSKKKWTIEYIKEKDPEILFTEWQIKYHKIFPNEEYVIVKDEFNDILYVINVTGDSSITTLSELMKLIGNKF